MDLQYAVALIIAALISTIVAVIAWQRRTVVGARSLLILMSAAIVWSLTYAIRWLAHDEAAQLFWLDATYFGVVIAPTAFLVLALEYIDKVHILSSRVRIGLTIIPILTIIILWTDPWHGLFYNGMRTGDAILNGGAWFWIFIAYTYIILLLASLLIFRKTIRNQLFFQVQARLLLTGMALPWLGNIISLLGFSPFPGLDLTPFLFTASGILFMFALFRFGLLDIVPIAHSRLMEVILDGVIVLNKDNRIVDFNPAAQKILGLTTALVGQPIHQAAIQVPKLALLDRHISAEKSEIQIKNDDVHQFEMRTLPLLNKNNQITGNLITLHDISEYRQAQERIRRSEEQYRLLIDNAVESILVVQNRVVVFSNPVASELTGYPKEELINESFVKFIYPDDIPLVMENYHKRVSGEDIHGRYQFRIVRKDRSFRWVETSGIRIDWKGELATLHFIIDVTERKKVEVALEFRSTHDILTGLYNRQFFEQEIDRLQNSRIQPVSLLVMDMNGLKEINDTQGHAAGDEQLKVAAQVIRKAFRPDDIVARIGGDEFVIILPETNTNTAQKVVGRLKQIIDEFNQQNLKRNPISFAIGFASNESNPDLQSVLRNADRDMYIQKAKHYAVQ
ncbi:MAG: diguanylate cyclase [Anaerolineaceae bacterium]|nr:diguanylate cyclase [Anaerolineaceae bacterium]